MPETVTTPVVIVGAGPVGLCLALELDHHGIEVALIEPRTSVDRSRPRAKTTSARTMEHFRRWGVADAIREAAPLKPQWSDRVSFVTTVLGEEITHFDECFGLRTPLGTSPEHGQQISQGLVEEVLRAAVAERPGIRTFYGVTATGITQDADGATVDARDASGEPRLFRARYAVGADGARSVVRKAMGAVYEGSAVGAPNVNAVFRAPDLAGLIPHPRSLHYWTLAPGHVGVVGPLDLDGTWWAIAVGAEPTTDPAVVERLVHGLLGEPVPIEIVSIDPWQAKTLITDAYRNERLFLVGDAAHQNPPWGGHGFNTGVGDAVNLGWKLAAVLAGWAPDELLDSYDRERRMIEEQTIDLAAANMRALGADERDEDASVAAPDAGAVPDAASVQRAKDPEFHAEGMVFGYGYTPAALDQSPTIGDYRPVAAPGNRLPHELVRGRSLYDLLGREFTVLGALDDAAPLLGAAARRGVPAAFVASDGPLRVVRPDQHLAWVGAPAADADGDPDVDPDAVWDAVLRAQFDTLVAAGATGGNGEGGAR